MKIWLTALIFSITQLVIGQVVGEVNFVAKVNKEKLGMNERLKIVFEIDRDGDNFVAPDFNGFKISSGPSQSVSRSWVNGKKSFSKSFTYYLTPSRKGVHIIGQATIQLGGNTYKTNPLKVEVTSAVSNPSEGQNPDYVADKSLHLVASVSNKNPYLNEAISLEYRLYWDLDVSINAPQETDTPQFKDFWNHNIEIRELKAERGTYKGKDAGYVVMKKVVLYPQKTGKLNISPLTLSVPVQVPTNRRDIFGRRLTNTVEKTVSAGKTVINVKPLPSNAPDNFTGAVGNFSFRATQTKNELKATESLQVKLEVSGNGNLKLFKLPELQTPSSIEVYDPEHKENIRTNLAGMSGKISDTYTLVPQFKGSFPIPGVSFSYFDPKQEKYKTIDAKNLTINVTEGPTQSNTSIANNNNSQMVTQQKVTSKSSNFAYIKTEANLKSVKADGFFKSKLFWGLFFLPLLAIPATIVVTKRSEAFANDIAGSKIRKANKLAKKYLSTAKKNLGDSTNFYVALEKALHNYLKASLSIETNEMNKDRIAELLTAKNVDEPTISQFNDLLQTCEMARYTPSTLQTMKEDYEKASQVISQIDKQL